jgi:hypothetical protein
LTFQGAILSAAGKVQHVDVVVKTCCQEPLAVRREGKL